MAAFDEVYAQLAAKMDAAMAVIAANPEIAAQVKAAIDSAVIPTEIQEQQAQDAARANALNNIILEVRQVLAAAVPAPDPEPVYEPPVDLEDPEVAARWAAAQAAMGTTGATGPSEEDTGATGGDTGATGAEDPGATGATGATA